MTETQKPVLSPKPTEPVKATKTAEEIAVPKEYSSMNKAIRVEIQGDQITIDLDPVIVQEIGAFHRCKVKVRFRENQGPQIMPYMPVN